LKTRKDMRKKPGHSMLERRDRKTFVQMIRCIWFHRWQLIKFRSETMLHLQRYQNCIHSS